MPVLRSPRPRARSRLARTYAVTVDRLLALADDVEDRAVDGAQQLLGRFRRGCEKALRSRSAAAAVAAVEAAARELQDELLALLVRAQTTTLEAGAAQIEVLRPIARAVRVAESLARAREQRQLLLFGSGAFPSVRIEGVKQLITQDLQGQAAHLAAADVTTLAGAARDRIVSAVRRATVGGSQPIDAMAEVDAALPLDKRGARVAKGLGSSAERIVRTQLNGLYGRATQEAAGRLERDLGAKVQKEWIATLDDRTRAAHLEANGQRVPVDQPFVVGGEKLMHPGGGAGSARNVINCRCRSVVVLPDDPEDLFRDLPPLRPEPPRGPAPAPEARPRSPVNAPPTSTAEPPRPLSSAAQADAARKARAAQKRSVREAFSKPTPAALVHAPINLPRHPAGMTIQDQARAAGNATLFVRQFGLQGVALNKASWSYPLPAGEGGRANLRTGELKLSAGATQALSRYLAWAQSHKTQPAPLSAADVYDGVRVLLHETTHLFGQTLLSSARHVYLEEGITETITRDLVDRYMARHRAWRGSALEAEWRRTYLGARGSMPGGAHYNAQTSLVREIVDSVAAGAGVRVTGAARAQFLLRAKELGTYTARVDYLADQLTAAHDLDARERTEARKLIADSFAGLTYSNSDRSDVTFRAGMAQILAARRRRGARP